MNDRIVSNELVYTGRICRVRKVGIQTDSGDVVPRGLIEFDDAVVIVPVLADGSVVLIRNQRFAVGEELLEFPAGKLDGDESPETGAARELTEETGYRGGRLERVGGFYTGPGAITEFIHAFVATGLTAGPQELEKYEKIRVEVVPARRVRELIAAGELHDAKSISAWTLWQLRQEG